MADSGHEYALGRLVRALDAWEADCFLAKSDLERARAVDEELQAARFMAARVLKWGSRHTGEPDETR